MASRKSVAEEEVGSVLFALKFLLPFAPPGA